MGWGDEILAAGEARAAQEADPKRRRVRILDRNGAPRWHRMWEGNPRIARPGEPGDFVEIVNGAWCRPYVDYERMRREFHAIYPDRKFRTKKVRDPRLPWRFTDHRCKRGEIRCIAPRVPGGYVVVEPHHKPAQVNRDWGWDRWQAVVDAVEADWLQINPRGARLLRGVRHDPADDFIRACEILSSARLYVGPEGGLYHAAAALGVPAVAIFGGYISPANQGYDGAEYVNFYEPMEGASPCGQRVPCDHCRTAMDRIAPQAVIEAVRRLSR